MTEQEAEMFRARAFRARLRRIWGPVIHRLPIHPTEEWVFDAVLKPDVRLEVLGKPGREEFFLRLFTSPALRWVSLVAEMRASQNGMITWNPIYEEEKALATQFVLQWMEFFRRNCWLTGCPIEASAHEKTEWMQGFRREEIEAWNLKM